jgi:hypothetical protein
MAGIAEDHLKEPAVAPDTSEVNAVARHTSKLVLAVVALIVVGAAVASAAAVGVGIGDPLGFERRSDGTTVQVLPLGPTTTVPATGTGAGAGGAAALSATALTSALRAVAPGAAHEGTPHGVPAGWDWASRAVAHGVQPPSTDSRFVNLWGQVYVDQTNVRPSNTRVAISGCELWRLPATGTTWERLQGGPGSRIEGGAWSEDFSRDGGPFSLRTEADGSQSTVTADGWNSHFWTRDPLADSGTGNRAFLVACSARLVLADPALPDDRASSTYLVSVGADWRKSDYACPVINGITVCNSIGISRMLDVTNTWRRVVMTSTDLGAGLPLPPVDVLRNPDGTYGG